MRFGSSLTVALGKPWARPRQTLIVLSPDQGAAVLERITQIIVPLFNRPVIVPCWPVGIGVQALLKISNLLILSLVPPRLPAFVNDAVIQVQACDESAGDCGYQSSYDKCFLHGLSAGIIMSFI